MELRFGYYQLHVGEYYVCPRYKQVLEFDVIDGNYDIYQLVISILCQQGISLAIVGK